VAVSEGVVCADRVAASWHTFVAIAEGAVLSDLSGVVGGAGTAGGGVVVGTLSTVWEYLRNRTMQASPFLARSMRIGNGFPADRLYNITSPVLSVGIKAYSVPQQVVDFWGSAIDSLSENITVQTSTGEQFTGDPVGFTATEKPGSKVSDLTVIFRLPQ
jgi:hypothetical protein